MAISMEEELRVFMNGEYLDKPKEPAEEVADGLEQQEYHHFVWNGEEVIDEAGGILAS